MARFSYTSTNGAVTTLHSLLAGVAGGGNASLVQGTTATSTARRAPAARRTKVQYFELCSLHPFLRPVLIQSPAAIGRRLQFPLPDHCRPELHDSKEREPGDDQLESLYKLHCDGSLFQLVVPDASGCAQILPRSGTMKEPVSARLLLRLFVWLTAALWSAAPGLAATLTVTTTNDSGAGSLRQAIADAASGDSINSR